MGRVSDPVRETRQSLATVFRNPGLRRLNLAFAGSAIGDWAYATAIVVWAYGVGGATAVGIWGTVRLVLMTVVTPFASTLVDRFPRKTVMVSSDLTRAVVVLVGAALIWVDAPVLVVFVLATLAGLVGTPFRPAVAALLPKLVSKPEELTASNGTLSTLESLAFFAGPAIGGVLLSVADVPVVIVFNGLTFIWSAALVSRIQVPIDTPSSVELATVEDEGAAEDPTSGGFFAESAAGFREIWRHPDLRLVSLVYCAQTIVAGASIVFTVVVAVEATSFGADGVGYLNSMLGVGAIVGGFFAIARASSQRLATDFGVGVLLWAMPLLLIAVWPQAWAAFMAMFVIGVANPVVDVNASTIMQRLAPDEVLGRVFGALETVLIGSMALGSIVMPLLIAMIGLQLSLTVLALVIVALVLPSMVRLHRLDGLLRAPEGLELLRQLSLFAPLVPKSLELVARRLVRVEVSAGAVVIREGDEGDRFYVIESGRATASYRGEKLRSMGPGDPFGEIALLRDVPRTATVTADEPMVLLALDRQLFLDAVTGDSEVNNRADDLISQRIPTY
ncbi:MAG: MFS transporter [Actinomycetia bacterium]|nr:MFS transporter [Actinomycetes bacterium]